MLQYASKIFTIPSAVNEYSKQELPFICNEVTFNIYFVTMHSARFRYEKVRN